MSDAIAAILSRDPDWNLLPVATPVHIRTLLRRCLHKDAQKRLPHIGVARLEIDEGPGPSTVKVSPTPTQTGIAKSKRLAAATALLFLSVALGVAVAYLRPAAVASRMYTSSIVLPSDLLSLPGDRLALSPDGQHVAFVAAGEDGRPMLWVRPLGSLTAKPLDGTEGVSGPFWSPDSRQVAFAAGGKLKRVDLAGGSAITLTDTDMSLRGAWSPDGVILFPQAQGLFKVSVAGGPPSPVLAMPELAYYPSFLPDGRHFVYLSARSIYVASLDRAEPQRLLENAGNAMYAQGHLVFIRETTLYAQPFDPDQRTLSGSPFSVAERVQISTGSGAGAFSVSQDGLLVYQPTNAGLSQLAWFDRNGRRIRVMGEQAWYHPDPRLSADDSRGVVSVIGTAGDESDIWLFDVDRGVKSRITYDSADEIDPLLSPDGKRVVFSSRRGQRKGVYLKTIESTAAPELLLEEDQWTKVPLSFSPDGHHLLYSMFHPQTSFDLWVLALSGDRRPVSFVRTVGDERHGAFSPDGRWIVYESSESGRNEVYVSPFPATGAKWPVSTSGGENPHWRGDGQEVFFLNGRALMRAEVTLSTNRVAVGAVQPLFEEQRFRRIGVSNPFDVSADGQRFLFNISTQTGPDPLTLVINWTAGLR
jgi:Tol biopolymer transport system component